MPGFTKEVIVQTLLELLNEKPLAKITVKDIVERCGVNRNTFYYHFRDIPDVVEFVMKREMDSVINDHGELNSIGDCMEQVIHRIEENRKAMLHIYRSIQRDVFVHYLDYISTYVVQEYLDKVAAETVLSKEDEALILRFYKCLIVGFLMDWLDHGLEYDLAGDVKKFGKLYEANHAFILSKIAGPFTEE